MTSIFCRCSQAAKAVNRRLEFAAEVVGRNQGSMALRAVQNIRHNGGMALESHATKIRAQAAKRITP